jgi:multimeric flavodoxin WrbA
MPSNEEEGGMSMKIHLVGVSTSSRIGGNTERMVKESLNVGQQLGGKVGVTVETDLVTLAGKRIQPCLGCGACVRQGTYCVIDDDWLEAAKTILNGPPDGLIVGTPVYFFNMNATGRAFLERFTCTLKKLWVPEFPHEPPDFSHTAAGSIAVGADRYGGAEHAVSTIIHWFLTMGFVVSGGFYIGACGYTKESDRKNAVEMDTLGLESARLVGRKVLKTAILLKSGYKERGRDLPFILWKNPPVPNQ